MSFINTQDTTYKLNDSITKNTPKSTYRFGLKFFNFEGKLKKNANHIE